MKPVPTNDVSSSHVATKPLPRLHAASSESQPLQTK